MNKKKIFWLAVKTFLQAFAGYIGSANITDSQTMRIVIAAAIACGMSALMNISWDELEKEKADTAESEEKADE